MSTYVYKYQYIVEIFFTHQCGSKGVATPSSQEGRSQTMSLQLEASKTAAIIHRCV